jgi:hypothetical protein
MSRGRGYSRRVQPVAVRILHRERDDVGPLQRALLAARWANAERLASLFLEAGAEDVEWSQGRDDAGSFGARLRREIRGIGRAGLVVLGSGAIPLGTSSDVGAFVAAARSGERRALANNRYSADVVAIGQPSALRDVPDLVGDNALPRWLEEVGGFDVADLRSRPRLAMDLDSPLDVVITGGRLEAIDVARVEDRLAAVAAVARNRRAELVVAGRTNAGTLRWLEQRTEARVRAVIEERGLRASAAEALGGEATSRQMPRPPSSILGLALDDRGPEALGAILEQLGDAAIVDTRVLLAHRLGADESGWPKAEDRFASDLLLPDRIDDAWLRGLTKSAVEASIPILLGGHSLVGPGIRLILRRRR